MVQHEVRRRDMVLTRLSNDGRQIVSSTYSGGSKNEAGSLNAVASPVSMGSGRLPVAPRVAGALVEKPRENDQKSTFISNGFLSVSFV